MSKKRWEQLRLQDVLKMDAFQETIRIREPGEIEYRSIITRQQFFEKIYVHATNNEILCRIGTARNYELKSYSEWSRGLSEASTTQLILIEGYAGCGKSVFVQRLLKDQLNTLDYDCSYYNYDIGAGYEKNNRISDVIRENFIDQLANCVIRNETETIDFFESLIKLEEISALDSSRQFFYCVFGKNVYKDSISELRKNSEYKPSFRTALYEQMKNFNLEQILAIDWLLRIAKYRSGGFHFKPAIYICYDNLDSIENIKELEFFVNTLMTVRRNLDEFIEKIADRYFSTLEEPHFVIISTLRKITASRVHVYGAYESERAGDNYEDMENTWFVDASEMFQFSEMVENRKDYLTEYISHHGISDKRVLNDLVSITDLFKTQLMDGKYASLWNHNYRTCSEILELLNDLYPQELKNCISLYKENIDGYDNKRWSSRGASSLFLHLICKLYRDREFLGEEHLDVISLVEQSKKELTSISRVILTIIKNKQADNGVGMNELYDELYPLFTAQQINNTVCKLLTRQRGENWRRPICYYMNPPKEHEDLIIFFNKQFTAYRSKQNGYAFSTLKICECGDAFINLICCDYEYFMARLDYQKSLYQMNTYEELKNAIEDVFSATERCCQNMERFGSEYIKKMNLSGWDEYLKSCIHPRTASFSPQLHSERLIFRHIDYLNSCRAYHVLKNVDNEKQHDHLNKLFLDSIADYIDLYWRYPHKYTEKRDPVATILSDKVKKAKSDRRHQQAHISIEIDGNMQKQLEDIFS